MGAGLAIARTLGFGGHDADDAQQSRQDHHNLEHQIAGQADRGKLEMAEFAGDDLRDDDHRDLGQIGTGERYGDDGEAAHFSKRRRLAGGSRHRVIVPS
jgi:hypothetical protein